MEVLIGQRDAEHVIIDVQGCPDPGDDHGWLICEINIKAGAWSGSYSAYLRNPDFPLLREHLEQFQHDPTAIAVFDTLEGQLKLEFKGDRRGHIEIQGTARDKAGIGNQLAFELEIDQSYLPKLIEELRMIEQQFPVGELS